MRYKIKEFLKGGNIMINSLNTSNGISYLARQTTDMAPVTVDSTIVPTSASNLRRTDNVFVNNSFVNIKTEQAIIRTDVRVKH